jgi:hypothetical protein
MLSKWEHQDRFRKEFLWCFRPNQLYLLEKRRIDFRVFPFNMQYQKREEAVELKQLLYERWAWFANTFQLSADIWGVLSEFTRWYLVLRACDLYYRHYNASFPPPANSGLENVVSGLVRLLRDRQKRLDEAKNIEEEAQTRERIERECARQIVAMSYGPPELLSARVLNGSEIEAVKRACLGELQSGDQAGWNGEAARAVIEKFVECCTLLSRPENHIRVYSGQCVETEVPGRAYRDMADEMVQLLVSYRCILRRQSSRAFCAKVRL